MTLNLDTICYEKIVERLSNNYVSNIDYSVFLENNQYRILLDKYICIMYGNTEGNIRKIQFVQFLYAYFLSKSKISYHVHIYEHNYSLWVQDTLTLRKKFFHFIDKTSLLRTCFLYDPKTEEIYRLQELRYNIFLPYTYPYEEKMYKSPQDFTICMKAPKGKKEEYEEGVYYPLICEERKKQIYNKMLLKLEHFSKSFN